MKTKKMKKVLIALDYNPTAQKVAESGYALANTLGAEIILLHIISDPVFYYNKEYSPIMGFSGYIDLSPIQIDSVDSLISVSFKYLDAIRSHLGDNAIQTMVKEGDYANVILHTAKEMHADIIIMGSHSQKWLENILLGSVTEKVLHRTLKPLFIIPTKKGS
jgi:nucleotide-binding universal stress UspA family protein